MADYFREPNEAPPGERDERDFASLSARLDRLWPGDADPQSPLSGRRIAHFDLEGPLGVGSFGVVYLATDTRHDRRVALKLPRPEVLFDEDKRRRFAAEAELVADLDHPGIVPVLDADLDGPTPYIASEYVAGPNLEQWLADQSEPAAPDEAARFIRQLADAVDYAHRLGVVHRDLKPSNVLLGNAETEALEELHLSGLTPRLADFGLAKHADLGLTETRSSVMIGTPLYMAPEQFSGNDAQGSPATDVYALGVMFFELLTRSTPHQGSTYVAVADAIRNQSPTPLRRLRPELPNDVQRIVGKCLEPEPKNRYSTAAALSADLGRHLAGEEVVARHGGWRRALGRMVARRPQVTALVTSIVVLIAATVVAVGYYQNRLSNETARFEQTADRLDQLQHAEAMAIGFERLQKLDARGVRSILTEQVGSRGSFAYTALRELAKYPKPRVLSGHVGRVSEVATRPGRPEQLVSVGEDGTIRVWDWTTGELKRTLEVGSDGLYALAVSRDGASVFTGMNEVAERDLRDGRLLRSATIHETTLEEIALSPTGDLLAAAARFGPIRLASRRADGSWDTEAIDDIRSDVGPESLSFVDDSTLLGLAREAARTSRICRWDARTGVVLRQHAPVSRSSEYGVAQSNDGSLLAAVGTSRLAIRDATTDAELWRSPTLAQRCGDVAFSPTDAHMAFAGADGVLWLLQRDAIGGRWSLPVTDPRSGFVGVAAHDGRITSLCFPDAGHVATAGLDGLINIWPLRERRDFEIPLGTDLASVAVTADGTHCVCITPDDHLETRLTESQTILWRIPLPRPATGKRLGPAFASSGGLVATAGGDAPIRLRSLDDGEIVFEAAALRDTEAVGISPDGKWLVACDRQGHTIRIWKVETAAVVHSERCASPGIRVSFSPDGGLLAIVQATDEGTLVLATDSWTQVARLQHPSDPRAVAFHPNGGSLATTHNDGSVRTWNLSTGAVEAEFLGLESTPSCVAYHPSGDWLVSYSQDGVLLYDLRVNRRIGVLFQRRPDHGARYLNFGNDGSLYAHFRGCPWLLKVGGDP